MKSSCSIYLWSFLVVGCSTTSTQPNSRAVKASDVSQIQEPAFAKTMFTEDEALSKALVKARCAGVDVNQFERPKIQSIQFFHRIIWDFTFIRKGTTGIDSRDKVEITVEDTTPRPHPEMEM